MSLRYLLDTDWVIHYLNARASVVRRVDTARDEGVALSILSLAELYEGVYYSRDPQKSEAQLDGFLRGIAVLGIDAETCRRFGKERGRLRAVGRMVGDFDLMIGASALQHDLIVLTDNRRHFEEIEGLRLESR